jgi:hypothetical protein
VNAGETWDFAPIPIAIPDDADQPTRPAEALQAATEAPTDADVDAEEARAA